MNQLIADFLYFFAVNHLSLPYIIWLVLQQVGFCTSDCAIVGSRLDDSACFQLRVDNCTNITWANTFQCFPTAPSDSWHQVQW